MKFEFDSPLLIATLFSICSVAYFFQKNYSLGFEAIQAAALFGILSAVRAKK
ncbi:hypothetical protein M0R19_08065 [Candidatus Pacearchaeota archaeon]|nr:hypothetical protein [Candidatus Pacearchaeota archaeon]